VGFRQSRVRPVPTMVAPPNSVIVLSTIVAASISPMHALASALGGTDPASPWHAAESSTVAVGPATPVSVIASGSPSDGLPYQSPFTSECVSESSLTPPMLAPTSPVCPFLEDDLCSPPELEDERPSSVVLLHIVYEVASQLDKAEDFRLLPPEEESLRDFLVDQITSSQLVVEVQNTVVPSMAQDSLVFDLDLWHP
jgi:hypothetical protein